MDVDESLQEDEERKERKRRKKERKLQAAEGAPTTIDSGSEFPYHFCTISDTMYLPFLVIPGEAPERKKKKKRKGTEPELVAGDNAMVVDSERTCRFEFYLLNGAPT